MAEDYYRMLGVSRDASNDDIQKAYRKLARKYHPDLHPDDKAATKKFQEVQKAFDVLNDPSKREQYDRFGESFEAMGGRGGPGGGPAGGFRGPSGHGAGGHGGAEGFDFGSFFGGGGGEAGESGGSFSDIFSQFRRPGSARGPRSAGPQRGADAEAELEIPFTTAVLGGEVQMMIRRQSGRTDTIEVKIPAGIGDGKKIRLRSQGEQPAGAAPGDLLITVHVQSHPHFQRRGDNLDVKVPVTLAEAALGAKIDVPTPKGVISLRVPPGTSSGKKFRVKGHGVAAKGRPVGDLFAEIQILLPNPLDSETLELIKQIDARMTEAKSTSPREELHW